MSYEVESQAWALCCIESRKCPMDQSNKPMTGHCNFTKSHNIIVMWHFMKIQHPRPAAALLMYGIA